MIHANLIHTLTLQAANASFVWTEHLGKIVSAALLSMVPLFEGRYALATVIPLGVPPLFAYLLAAICSTIPVPFILLLLRPILDWFYTLPIKPVQKFAAWLERRSEKKRAKMGMDSKTGFMGWLAKHFSAETVELIALYVFVALPLPGTGAWTGSAVATLFEMPRGKSFVAILLGNFTACLITTLATTGVVSLVL